jgi:tetratricopeptide (TPR) repeat protein
VISELSYYLKRCILFFQGGVYLQEVTPTQYEDDRESEDEFQPSQPAPLDIFFGRDDIVTDFASLVVRNEPTRLALLGSGGIGKTSTALHILHHQDVVARYEDHRYFVGCDAVTSAEDLVALILRIIRAPSTSEENIVTVLARVLHSVPLTLLLLDNFETVWNINSERGRVTNVLREIENANNVSLVITMRGIVPPVVIRWTRFDCLNPLSHPDAKRVFLAINPSMNDPDRRDKECLDTLLTEMDCVPLAIRLVAQVSIGFSPQYMLNRWRKETTVILHAGEELPVRLESVDVSISLSLAALDIKNNPETVQLLGILSQLPDGLHRWEERLPVVAAGLLKVRHLVYLLRKIALLFTTGSTLKVLSPIKHFINLYHEVDSNHIRVLQNYFWDLIHTHAVLSMEPGFDRGKKILEADMGNIRSLVKNAMQSHPSPELVEVVLEISKFQMITNPSTQLLYDIIPLAKHVQSAIQEARVLQTLGIILHIQTKYAEASEILTKAQTQFLDIGNVRGAAQCSQSLGNIFRMLCQYTEASNILTEARTQFLNIGDALGAAQCSRSMGDILYMQAKYTEASNILREAQTQFLTIGDVLGAAQCSQSMGDILYNQAKYMEASRILTKVQTQFLDIGNVHGVAQCSQSLGNILRMLCQYTEASNILMEARTQFLNIGDALGAAQCSQSMGDILYNQAKYMEASRILTKAQTHFLDIGNVRGAAQCSQSLGNILYVLGKYTEASNILREAQTQFLTIGDALGAAQCSQNMGDILYNQAKYAEAFKILTEAQTQFLDISNVHGTAQGLQSLGYILYMLGKYTGASNILREARTQFRDIGNVCGAAQCSQNLGNIFYKQAKYTEASEILMEARTQFLDIGEVLCVAQCSQNLGDILYMEAKYTEASEILMEARTQFLDIGNVHGAAQCSQNLGNIFYKQAKYTEASEILMEAQTQFLDIGNVHSAAQCSQNLGKIFYKQAKYIEASAILMEAQTQFLAIGNVHDAAQCLQHLHNTFHVGKYT